MLASLEVSLWPHEIPSPMQFSQIPHFQKPNPHFCPISLLNHLPILAHSGKPSTQFFIEILQTKFHSPQMHPLLPIYSSTFSKIKLIVSASNFYHLIPMLRSFFHLPRLQSWSVLIQPLSLKFTNISYYKLAELWRKIKKKFLLNKRMLLLYSLGALVL